MPISKIELYQPCFGFSWRWKNVIARKGFNNAEKGSGLGVRRSSASGRRYKVYLGDG